MAELFTFTSLAAFAAIAALEFVLGADNAVFIAILAERMPKRWWPFTRGMGLALAAAGRIILIVAISWIITLQETRGTSE